jgi:hypothetical protein
MDRNTSNDLDGKPDFLKHVFNFDDTGKSEMLNMLQYSVLSIIPIVFLNKVIQKFIPEADDAKGSFELLAELLAQMFTMFLGIILINRIVTYLPTYSGVKYMEINLVNIVLGFLMIVFSLQTKLGEKVNIILARIIELWDGTPSRKQAQPTGNTGTGAVRVTQPISPPMHQPSQSDNLSSNAIGLLPQGQPGMSSSMQQNIPSQQPQQNDTNFQQMYSGPQNPLQNAEAPMEPMAANEAIGGSAFGGLF